jgi:membrane protease YdiL (CAAX protease family)
MMYAPTLAQLANKILLAPLFETLVFQFLIIEAARRLKWPSSWQLWVSVGIFTAAHAIGGGVAHGLLSGAIGGYYLAFTYVIYRERSPAWAFGMTLAFHSLHNGLTAGERFVKYG